MVQILPQFDPGAQIGQNIGSGFGQALNMLGQRQYQQSAIDQLQKNIDSKFYESVPGANGQMVRQQRQDIDPLQMLTELYKGTAGIPGLPQSITETLGPLLINRARGQAYIGGSGRPGTAAPQQAQSAGQAGPQAQQMSTQSLEGAPVQQNQGNQPVQSQGGTQGINLSGVKPIGTQPPAYVVPDRQQFMSTVGRAIIDAGGTSDQAEAAYSNEIKASQLRFDAEKAAYDQAIAQQAAARGLEAEQNAFIKNQAEDWQAAKKIQPDQFYNEMAYKRFDQLRNENPGATDQQLWAKVKPLLDNFHDAEVTIAANKPAELLRSGARQNQITTLKKSVQNALQGPNNNRETRERFISDLMGGGWEEDFARAIVNSPSDQLNEWFKNTEDFAKTEGGRVVREALSPGLRLMGSEPGAPLDPLIEKQGMPKLGADDDIVLLRNRLITERKWPVQTANELIRRLADEGNLTDYQKSQLPQIELGAPVPGMPYLIDIFSPENAKPAPKGSTKKSWSWLPSFLGA